MNEKGISGFAARIQWIYQRAFSRNPSEEEMIRARSFFESLKKKYQGKDKNRQMKGFGRILFIPILI